MDQRVAPIMRMNLALATPKDTSSTRSGPVAEVTTFASVQSVPFRDVCSVYFFAAALGQTIFTLSIGPATASSTCSQEASM